MLLTVSACSAEVTVPDTPTPTQVLFSTATLPPTLTPLPSPTSAPATATLPVVPAQGQTTSQLNVRSIPSADGELLGSVNIGTNVQILGKDPTSAWWMIAYPGSPNGNGWILAQYVQVDNPSDVPVFGAQPQTTTNAPVTEAGPTDASGGAQAPSPVPTAVLASAYPDGDSMQAPSVSMTLSSAAMRSFNFSSDISFPEGDPEDWVQFQISGASGQQTIVAVTLNCSGSSALNLELIQNGVQLQGWDNIVCGQTSQLQLYLFSGAPYALRMTPAQGNNALSYVAYTVIVQLTK